ncbi:transmembrane protein DUF3566 [Mumia flava]|uniref:Transmembrane protein DUF3566 n=1 Tax=Mumia flava TaxID=1348852 RepID=A0A2M9BI73_9ACTN|nr:DUF3566 domain-containing protein [Mumia flava]PJJ57640.1 transmembrane protein DUF3566 [Mumia flava]
MPAATAGSIAAAAERSQDGLDGPGDATRVQPAVAEPVPAPARRPKPYDEPATSTQPAAASPSRKARLRIHRVDPWSVMKMSFALAIALGIVTVVAVTIVWAVLGAAGVWEAINQSVATVLNDNADAFDISEYVGFGRIIGLTIVIAAIDVVLITALATVGAFLYNLAAHLLGGFEVTLAEDD